MEENLFVNVEYFPTKHAASRFSVRKNVTKKKDRKRVTLGWIDISGPGTVSFLSRSFMYYIMLTLHDPINPQNVVSTSTFSWASNFASLNTWCTNEMRRLELTQYELKWHLNLSNKQLQSKSIVLPPSWQE